MRRATQMLFDKKVDFQVDGEMHADAALDPVQRERTYPHSRLTGQANVLIFPSLDAANITYESIRVLADALPVGPILIGAARPVHVVTASTTARGIVNMTAVAVVEAQAEVREQAAAE
jgi:malate dehydrogenase (oxaloacetate-decarboxylating)(NADP+)